MFKHTAAVLTALLALSACQSKASLEKHREQLLTAFVTKVAQHVLDRNPATINESMTMLTHEELTDRLVEKLQTEKFMPETSLDVLRIVDESKTEHLSNKVVVTSVTAQGDASKPEVPFKVLGKDIKLIDGKEGESKDFDYTITCKLTPDMEDYPKVVDFAGVPSYKAPASASAKEKEKEKEQPSKSTHKRHHR